VRALRDLGKTVVLTTHYLEEAQALADRVAILRDGLILAEGAPGTLGEARYRVTWRAADGDLCERFTEDPTALLHELTGAALARGERLEELTVSRPSLEDVYLQLTEAAAV
jgi:ABC-2 type transport system ATP-binding protein